MAKSDIVPEAGATIAAAPITDIHVIGRRGPENASFTNPELAEFGRLARAVAVTAPIGPDVVAFQPLTHRLAVGTFRHGYVFLYDADTLEQLAYLRTLHATNSRQLNGREVDDALADNRSACDDLDSITGFELALDFQNADRQQA